MTKAETLFHQIADGLPNTAKSKMISLVWSFEIIRDGFYCGSIADFQLCQPMSQPTLALQLG